MTTIHMQWKAERHFSGSQISCRLTGRFHASTYLEFPFFFLEEAPDDDPAEDVGLTCSIWPLELGVAIANQNALNN